MGGSVVAQLVRVMLAAASDGMLAGMYQGTPVLANCFAGFRVRQSVSGTGGVTVLVPVVNGVEVGTVFTPLAGTPIRCGCGCIVWRCSGCSSGTTAWSMVWCRDLEARAVWRADGCGVRAGG